MRQVVGIDLGTTHAALATLSLDDGASPTTLPITQLVAKDTLEDRTLLPSFVYLGHESDGAMALPWNKKLTYAVGEYARARGADAPIRLVSSAKSWLSTSHIDRREAFLPLDAPSDAAKISPVEASSRILNHLAEAFRATTKSKLSDFPIVLTVPASFDPAARDLTVEAAAAQGLAVTLLEEPQAALYAWLHAQGDTWRKKLHVGDVIVVIDVGGGTTDFSAIVVRDRNGNLELERLAVGDHILLGGDNMDLTIAHHVATKLGRELDPWQSLALHHACRGAKESLLSASPPAKAPIAIAGRGSALVGSTLRTELTTSEVQSLVVEGFFPSVIASEHPQSRARSALTKVGLPYASDPAITRHLAAFLSRHAEVDPQGNTAGFLRPTCVLFNGGVMKGAGLQARVVDCLNAWLKKAGASPVRLLDAVDLDLAVARGASVFGAAQQGKGIRIRGGTAKAYYVGVEGSAPAVPGMAPPLSAVCVAPFGMEEGSESSPLPEELGVVVGEPVRFRFFGSSTRRADSVGSTIKNLKGGDLEELAPIEVTLPTSPSKTKAARKAGEVVSVRLKSAVTPIGTLKLHASPVKPIVDGEGWEVELNVRDTGA